MNAKIIEAQAKVAEINARHRLAIAKVYEIEEELEKADEELQKAEAAEHLARLLPRGSPHGGG